MQLAGWTPQLFKNSSKTIARWTANTKRQTFVRMWGNFPPTFLIKDLQPQKFNTVLVIACIRIPEMCCGTAVVFRLILADTWLLLLQHLCILWGLSHFSFANLYLSLENMRSFSMYKWHLLQVTARPKRRVIPVHNIQQVLACWNQTANYDLFKRTKSFIQEDTKQYFTWQHSRRILDTVCLHLINALMANKNLEREKFITPNPNWLQKI